MGKKKAAAPVSMLTEEQQKEGKRLPSVVIVERQEPAPGNINSMVHMFSVLTSNNGFQRHFVYANRSYSKCNTICQAFVKVGHDRWPDERVTAAGRTSGKKKTPLATKKKK